MSRPGLIQAGNQSGRISGENKGETLVHPYVAIDLVDLEVETRKNGFVAKGKLSRKKHDGAEGYAVAAWTTACGDVHPTGAIGGPLK